MKSAQHHHAVTNGTGFTVIELIVTLAIVAIMASLAAPSFTGLFASTRVKGAASDLHIALLKARSEAVKRNAAVKVKPQTGSNWGTGWKVVLVSDETVVLATEAQPAGVTITNAVNPASVIYLPSGRIKGIPPAVFKVNANPPFTTAAAKKNRCRNISLVGVNGAPTMSKVDCP